VRDHRAVSTIASDGREIAGLTLDAMGCLVTLRDPVPELARLLEERGTPRPPAAIGAALRAEIAYYKAHHLEGRDPDSLRALQRVCAGLVADDLGLPLDEAFVDGFLAALRFAPLDGVLEALAVLDAAGVPMVCVSNWDSGLEQHLARLGIARHLRGVISSGSAGFAKPDPRIFAPALELLGLPPERVAHLGDEPVDRDGALAAGLGFLEPPVASLPERLGLR
jgi:putative hydrolase of the HAD superfamily